MLPPNLETAALTDSIGGEVSMAAFFASTVETDLGKVNLPRTGIRAVIDSDSATSSKWLSGSSIASAIPLGDPAGGIFSAVSSVDSQNGTLFIKTHQCISKIQVGIK